MVSFACVQASTSTATFYGDASLVAGLSSAQYYFDSELDTDNGDLTKTIVMKATLVNVPSVNDWAQISFSSAADRYEVYSGKIQILDSDQYIITLNVHYKLNYDHYTPYPNCVTDQSLDKCFDADYTMHAHF